MKYANRSYPGCGHPTRNKGQTCIDRTREHQTVDFKHQTANWSSKQPIEAENSQVFIHFFARLHGYCSLALKCLQRRR